MAAIHNYMWDQGADLEILMLYKKGPVDNALPVNLTGYSVRMDIVGQSGQRLYTFNSEELDDVNNETAPVPDTNMEFFLGPEGQIKLIVPRRITLPGGELYSSLTANPPQLSFNYDIFLRDAGDMQRKILKGQIIFEKSYTLWK